VFVTGGYHGTHAVLALQKRITNVEIHSLDACEDGANGTLRDGDVVHIETPINPTGEAVSIKKYADIAHAQGATLVVDSTFGPPGLQEPFGLGADVVMHSGTKYLGGHSDMLCGVLATRNEGWVKSLREERAVLGSGMGNMEAWLGVRSLRTLEVRVQRQSESATRLVQWLEVYRQYICRGIVIRVQHASLQKEGWVREQMPGGYGPVFGIWMASETLARRLPGKLKFFHHATSLGGVESLIEWRAMSDTTVDRRLLRVSVGLEGWENLRDDLEQGFEALWEEEMKSGKRSESNGPESVDDKVINGEANVGKVNGDMEIDAAMKEATLGV
jgi:cystathionine gamma-synthase